MPDTPRARQDATHPRRPDDSERRKWQDPDSILKRIGLSPGQTFIDLGSGSGFFALLAARIVGSAGKVYALDRDEQAIALLAGKARSDGLQNMQLKVGRAEETSIFERCADLVFLGIVLHDFDDPLKVLLNAARMLKSDGRLVNLDWKKEPTPWGPPLHIRFDEQQAAGLIERAGFEIAGTEGCGPYHYLVTARLKPFSGRQDST